MDIILAVTAIAAFKEIGIFFVSTITVLQPELSNYLTLANVGKI